MALSAVQPVAGNRHLTDVLSFEAGLGEHNFYLEMSMNAIFRNLLALAALAISSQLMAQVIFYEHENFQGRSFTAEKKIGDLNRYGFSDRASSVVVLRERWEVCEEVRFVGRCVVLRPGRYASLSAMGLNDRVSSVRSVSQKARIDDQRYAPPPVPVYDNRRRNNERLYEAKVISVRAVVGPPQQRCWLEREQVVQPRGDVNVPGALAGALLGGILGHQIGAGSGKDLATVGGVMAGAAVGANVGRDSSAQQVQTQEVQRCASVPSQAQPEFWDVIYEFRGLQHNVQMTTPPGPTITVNQAGEPRS